MTASGIHPCKDCGASTFSARGSEYYMVLDEVWLASGMGFDDGMLCIGCLEQRIGRLLTPADFDDCQLNATVLFGPKSDRLMSRLGWPIQTRQAPA